MKNLCLFKKWYKTDLDWVKPSSMEVLNNSAVRRIPIKSLRADFALGKPAHSINSVIFLSYP